MRENMAVHYTAELYDHYTATFVRAYDDRMVERVLEETDFRPAGGLLDVGTGTARLLVRMAREPQLAGLRLTGLDYFPDMMANARATVQAAGVAERVALLQGDAHALPCLDGSVSVIISRSTLHHWADPARALREMMRVLRPGGVAIVHDVRRDPDAAALAEFNRLRAEAGVEPSRLEEKLSLAEAEALIDAAGLRGSAEIFAPATGAGALGFEVRLRRAA